MGSQDADLSTSPRPALRNADVETCVSNCEDLSVRVGAP
jgi:hypothetical protein